MPVRMDEISAEKEFIILQNLRRCSAGYNSATLEYMATVSYILDKVHLMGGGHNRLPAIAATHKEIDHLALTLGIKGSRGLVQQQDFGIHDQNRGKRHSLLLSGREVVGRTVFQMRDCHFVHNFGEPTADLLSRPTKL